LAFARHEKVDPRPGLLLARTVKNERAADTLAALRDALLPKLISGEIRVSLRLTGRCNVISRKHNTVVILGCGVTMGSGFTAADHKLPGDRGFFDALQVDALLKTGGFPALACVLRSFRRSFVLPYRLPLGL
jgi:hypothetical protein